MNNRSTPAFLSILILSILIPYIYGEEYVSIVVDWEPRECGEVVVEPAGGNYSFGTQMVLTAKPIETCKFSKWVTDLQGLNNTITNPLYVTLFNNAYFKAVFIKIGAVTTTTATATATTERTTGEYVFVKISANISNFKEEVKIVKIGESVWISAPREIFLNDTARYVFVGWDGDISINTTEPMARITVTKNTRAIALYKLYMSFLELWYPAEEFAYFYAPIIDLGQGIRMNPKGIRVSFANITLPLKTPIPRELLSMIEPVYVKEYSLSIRCIDCGEIYFMLNRNTLKTYDYVNEWFEENSTVTLRILDEENPTSWVLGPRNHNLIMDGPKNVIVECERKPHAWSYGSPLYPIFQSIVKKFKNTSLYPFISNILSTPFTAYALIVSLLGAVAGVAYGLTMLAKKATMLKSSVETSLEKFIRKGAKNPEKILEIMPKNAEKIEREFHIENTPFPEIFLPYKSVNNPNLIAEPIKEVEVEKQASKPIEEESRIIGIEEILHKIESGIVDADTVIEGVASHPEIFRIVLEEKPVVEGSFKPQEAEELLKKIEDEKIIVLCGGDQYYREYIVQKLGVGYVRLENVIVKDPNDAWRTIQRLKTKSGVIVLGEEVDGKSFRNMLYAAKLMGIPIIKLSIDLLEGLENVEARSPDIFKLFGYIAYKILETGVTMSVDEAVELSRIARGMRGYITIDAYFKEVVEGEKKIDLASFEQSESSISFTQEESEALALWMRGGRPEQALEHYINVVSQIDPTGYGIKIKAFKEKLEKLSKLARELQALKEKVKKPSTEELDEASEIEGSEEIVEKNGVWEKIIEWDEEEDEEY